SGGDDPFGDFFSDPIFGGGIAMQIAAPAVKLQVKPLPPGAPADFSGTVGNYRLETSTEPAGPISEDDLLTYKIKLEGRGAVEQAITPQLILNDFEIVGQTPRTEKDNKPDQLGGTKTFEFVLRPKHAGRLSIPP